MTYRLLALDLDGTLLDQRMAITPAVRAAAKAASERGVTITIATGRTFRATMPYVEALGVSGPVICYQGGAIFDSQSGAMSNPVYVPADLAAQGAQMMLERGLFCLIYADEKIYIADDTRPELDYYRSFHPEGLDLVVAPDLPAVAHHTGALKVQFTADPAVIDRFQPDFQAAFQGKLDVLRSHDHYLELLSVVVDNSPNHLSPVITFGAGVRMAASPGYGVRLEIADLIARFQRLEGPVNTLGQGPVGSRYYHHLTAYIGLDIVLEKKRGRRY